MVDRNLWREGKKDGAHLAGTVVCGVAGGLLGALQAWLLASVIVRAYMGEATLASLSVMLWVLLAVIALRGLAGWGEERFALHLAGGVQQRLREMALDKIGLLGPVRLREERHGSLLTLLTEGLDLLEVYFQKYLPQLFKSGILPLVFLAVVFPRDPMTGVIMLVTAPLVPVFMALIGQWTKVQTKKQWRVLADMGGYFQDVLGGLFTLKLFGRTKGQRERIADTSDRFRAVNLRVLKWAFLSALVLELLTTISIALIAVGLGLRLLGGTLDFGTALFLLFLAPEFYLPLRSLGTQYHNSLNGAEAAGALFDFLEEDEAALPKTGDVEIDPAAPVAVEFRDVGFSYPGGRRALAGVSLTVGAGERVGVVGPSGGGKTTLLNLLCGYLVPDAGEILVDGVPAAKLGGDGLRERLAAVPQTPYFFRGTVLDNIRMGTDRSEEEVQELCRQVGADEFISGLPEGYHTSIGQGGRGLSGGEGQLLAIARAFCKDAPILLLDEATRNLDWERDRQVQAALDRLTRERTVICVAHRLATVMGMDRVAVLEGGVVVEAGPPGELLERAGSFAGLLRGELGFGRSPERAGEETETAPPIRRGSSETEAETGGAVSAPVGRMLALCRPYLGVMGAAALLGAAGIGFNAALLGFSSLLITRASFQPPVLDLMQIIVAVRFFGIGRALLRYGERYKSHDATFRILKNLRLWYYDRMEKLSFLSLQKLGMGRVFSHIIGDVEVLKFFYLRVLTVPAIAALLLVGACVALGAFSVRLAALEACLFLLCGAVLPAVYRRLFQRGRRDCRALRQRYSEALYDYVEGLSDGGLFRALPGLRGQILGLGEGLVRERRRIGCWDAFAQVATGLFANLALWGILAAALPLVAEGAMDGVYLATLCWVGWAAFESLQPVAAAEEYLHQSEEALLGMEEAASLEPEPQGTGTAVFSPETPLTVEGLCFSYGGEPALQDVSFTLAPGSKTAVVGGSGAGKTTLLNLLTGFLPYREGSICTGGGELRDVDREALRRCVGYLGQAPYLFHGTVRENILLAREGADETAMRRAAATARIDGFLTSLPEGYDTVVGENGYKLSAGQRQRIALARLVLQDTPVVVLDEATQNLDNENRDELLAALGDWWQGKTVLYVTHDLHGLSRMDQILVLDGGRLVERGGEEELLRSGGLYSRLHALSAGHLRREGAATVQRR